MKQFTKLHKLAFTIFFAIALSLTLTRFLSAVEEGSLHNVRVKQTPLPMSIALEEGSTTLVAKPRRLYVRPKNCFHRPSLLTGNDALSRVLMSWIFALQSQRQVWIMV